LCFPIELMKVTMPKKHKESENSDKE